MNGIRQPKGSKLCAQACIATLAKIDFQVAVGLCGSGELTEHEMLMVLNQSGVQAHRGNSHTGVSVIRYSHPLWKHWLVRNGNEYFSPAIGLFKEPPPWIANSSVTSQLDIS